jgi:hypothetical protein
MENNLQKLSNEYEQLVLIEDQLLKQAKLCEDTIKSCVQDSIVNGHDYDVNTLERLLTALQRVEGQVLNDLSMIRIQKGVYAFKMK